jgi:hypothetical protein
MLDCHRFTDSDDLIPDPAEPNRDTVWMTPAEVADRHRKEETSLANERYRGEGLPFTKLPSGTVRYNLADVIAVEKNGMRGFSWSRLNDALALMPLLTNKQRVEIISHLKKHM